MAKGMHRTRRQATRTWPAVLTLSLLGLGVSGYLWSVKRGAAALVCGPYGDCLAVNASPYSEIAGIPVAALGTFTYALLIIASFAAWRWRLSARAQLGVFGLALTGSFFSLYLTGIEAWVLHAYCIWCLTSLAIILLITAILSRHAWVLLDDVSSIDSRPHNRS